MNILENLSFSSEKAATLTVRNSDKQLIIAIGLMEGQILKKHISSTPAMIVVLKGAILFEMDGTTTMIREFQTFEIPATVPHEVTGLEESAFLLIKDKA